MPSVPYVSADLAEPREIVDAVRARRGGHLTHLDRMLLHSPPLASGWNSLLGAVRGKFSLDAQVREIQETTDHGDDAHVEGLHALGGRDAQAFHDQQAVQRGSRAVQLEQPFDHRARHFTIAAVRAAGQDAVHHFRGALEFAILERVQNGVTVGEVLIERAHAHACDFGDPRGGRSVRSFLFQNPNRSIQNGGDGDLGALLFGPLSCCIALVSLAHAET